MKSIIISHFLKFLVWLVVTRLMKTISNIFMCRKKAYFKYSHCSYFRNKSRKYVITKYFKSNDSLKKSVIYRWKEEI